MMRIYVFKGGKPITRTKPDRANPYWIDCDTLNETVLGLLKEKEVDVKKLLIDIHEKISYTTNKVALFCLRLINENMVLDKVWLFFLDGCVISRVRRSNNWNSIYTRLKLEAETKNLNEDQIFTYILSEIIESNGTEMEKIWKERDEEKVKKAKIILKEEEKILSTLLSKKAVKVREEQYDLLKESLETVKQQKSLFSSSFSE